MASESDSQAIDPLDENPVGQLDDPGNQMLCLLIRVASTPAGLKANPDPATVAMDDRVLWVAEPGLGPFKISLETEEVMEMRVADGSGIPAPGDFPAVGARRDGAGQASECTWRTGASHVVGGWPTRPATVLRYRLSEADGAALGDAMTLFITHPRRAHMGTGGTVRPDDPI